MIRDLEKEVVAIRNLLEVIAYQFIIFTRKRANDKDPLEEEIFYKAHKAWDKYTEHRVKRFDQEVDDAVAVVEKLFSVHGCEPWGLPAVPQRVFDDMKAEYEDRLKVLEDKIKELQGESDD